MDTQKCTHCKETFIWIALYEDESFYVFRTWKEAVDHGIRYNLGHMPKIMKAKNTLTDMEAQDND